MWMTMPQGSESPDAEVVPPLGERLLQSAMPREQLAIRALIEEGHLLTLDAVKAALVRETDRGVTCSWDGLSARLHDVVLDDDQRNFAALVLSLVTSHQLSFVHVIGMDERRLAIILRTIIRLSGNDTLAVGTRV
jgi:hypothetical protein